MIGKMFFGTFIVDPFLLFVLGYFVTRTIYKHLVTTRIFGSTAARRFFVILFPLTIIFMWLGGVLPYFNLVDSVNVYFGLLPQWLVGPSDGNGFMWNGLGVHLVKNIVPDSLIPTYHYLGFNILAVAIWLSYPLILGWGVLEGQAAALVKGGRRYKLLLEWLRILVIGTVLSGAAAALAALMVVLYS